MSVRITRCGAEDLSTIAAMLPAYLQEMGSSPDYPYLECYTTDPERKAYLVMLDGKVAGFALLNRHCPLGDTPDIAIAEFAILREFRRTGVGREAVQQLLETHSGDWSIAYDAQDERASCFWRQVTDGREVRTTMIGDRSVLTFTV